MTIPAVNIHHEIATCSFERCFRLADIIGAGNAAFAHGLLVTVLRRVVSEAMKSRRPEIGPKVAADRVEGPKDKARDEA